MRPSPEASSASNAACTTQKAPYRFVSMSLRQSSSEKRSARWTVSTTPALAITASQPPSDSIASATPRRTASGSRTSNVAVTAVTSPTGAPGTSQAATAQPHASSVSASARPIPPVAPVTMTRRPDGARPSIRRRRWRPACSGRSGHECARHVAASACTICRRPLASIFSTSPRQPRSFP